MIGDEIVRLKEIDSTNRFMMDWLRRERPREGTIVISGFQTAGRGMDKNKWESDPGLNLTFSFVLYPDFLAVDAQFYLNKVISLGLLDMVREIMPSSKEVSIKWPNDIYIGDHKVAGILIQNGIKSNQFEYSVIGIGLNINQDGFTGNVANPVSFKMMTGQEFDLEDILNRTIAKFEKRLGQLKEGNKTELDEEYLKALYRYGQLSDYLYKEQPVKAKINGVNRYGQLLLEIPGEKLIECDLKELKFHIPNP